MGSPSRGRIDVKNSAAQTRIAVAHIVIAGNERHSGGKHAVDPAAQDAFIRAGHADVANESGAARQDLLVCRRYVSVGAEDGTDPSFEVVPQEVFFTGGF